MTNLIYSNKINPKFLSLNLVITTIIFLSSCGGNDLNKNIKSEEIIDNLISYIDDNYSSNNSTVSNANSQSDTPLSIVDNLISNYERDEQVISNNNSTNEDENEKENYDIGVNSFGVDPSNKKRKSLNEIFQQGIDFVNNTCIFGAVTNYYDMKKTCGWTKDVYARSHFGNLYKKQKNYSFSTVPDLENIKVESGTIYITIIDKKFHYIVIAPSGVIKKDSLDIVINETIMNEDILNSHKEVILKGILNKGHISKGNTAWKKEYLYRNRSSMVYTDYSSTTQINENHKYIIENAHIAKTFRTRNCAGQARLFAYYLWKNAYDEIKRIEIVSGQNFDHSFCVINREKGSNLKDYTTWGQNAWVVDPWGKKFYPASRYKIQMEADLQEAENNFTNMKEQVHHK